MPTILYDYDPNYLPPEYLRAIGLLVTASAQTEEVLKMLLGRLLGADNIQSRAFTAHLNIPTIINAIKTLSGLDAPSVKVLDDLDDLLDKTQSLFEERNSIVHNPFGTDPTSKTVVNVRISAKGTLKAEHKSIELSEIERIAAQMYEVGMKIVEFMISVGLEPIKRNKPIKAPISRDKKARTQRRSNKR